MFSMIFVWINVWENNREAGDLRRYRAHYDVTVMETIIYQFAGSPQLTAMEHLLQTEIIWKLEHK